MGGSLPKDLMGPKAIVICIWDILIPMNCYYSWISPGSPVVYGLSPFNQFSNPWPVFAQTAIDFSFRCVFLFYQLQSSLCWRRTPPFGRLPRVRIFWGRKIIFHLFLKFCKHFISGWTDLAGQSRQERMSWQILSWSKLIVQFSSQMADGLASRFWPIESPTW